MTILSKSSPYIANENRLADVVAAIQAMSASSFHMRSFDRWAEAISGDASLEEHWRRVFVEHPEFFRLDTTRTLASLVWRRQHPKRYHVDLDRRLSLGELAELPVNEKHRLTREPLNAGDVKALIDAAISLHTSAVELKREGRWWVPLAASAVGGLVGAIVGTWL